MTCLPVTSTTLMELKACQFAASAPSTAPLLMGRLYASNGQQECRLCGFALEADEPRLQVVCQSCDATAGLSVHSSIVSLWWFSMTLVNNGTSMMRCWDDMERLEPPLWEWGSTLPRGRGDGVAPKNASRGISYGAMAMPAARCRPKLNRLARARQR